MRIFFLLSLFIIYTAPLYAQDDISVGDVRGMIWGVGQADVQEFETAEYFGSFENSITYEGPDMGVDAFITYFFSGDKLSQARIKYALNRPDAQIYVNDYIEIGDAITEIYGDPTYENLTFKSKKYRNDPQRWGIAAVTGDMIFETRWETPTTLIRLTFSGEDFKPDIRSLFISKTIAFQSDMESLTPDSVEDEEIQNLP